MKRFTPQEKLEIIRKYLTGGISVFSLCRQYHISKTIFYKWLSLYNRSRKNRIDALKSKVLKGKYHPKSLDYKQKLAILGLVHVHPEYSAHKIAEVLGIGNFGVQTYLYKTGLNKIESRTAFSAKPFWRRPSVQSREGMMDLYKQGWNVVDICKHFNISKPIFYKWKSRWDAAREGEKRQALADRNVRGPAHYKFLDDGKKQKIIEVVRNNPDFSVHKIHSHLAGEVGHFTVQNVLKREGLNTYQSRLRFSQENSRQPEIQTAPLYIPDIPLYKLRHLIAHFATVPKLLLTNPKRGLPYAAAALSTLVLVFLWIRLLFTTPYATPVGLFFASVALFFGLFFFIYSMKYYITVLLVLRLAQGGGLGRLGFFGRLAKVLGLKPGSGRVNPLTLNLDKITLRTHPFVSIHVALYNEKRVVERLIRACESQEYYEGGDGLLGMVHREGEPQMNGNRSSEMVNGEGQNPINHIPLPITNSPAAYEVIIADDSTDETTEICKELLSSNGRILDRTRRDEEMEVYVSSPPVGSSLPVIKLIHRFSRSGFKGAALQRALENTNPKAVYISVFDADFVPYPDTLSQFVKTFQELNGSQASNGEGNEAGIDEGLRQTSPNTETSFVTDNRIAAVQGYQWHVLNKSQTWITRGVRTEYAGSYVIERAGEEIYGGLKQIAGSVYAIRADILRQFGWGTSITEDFELTLRLYEKGYKVAFTPYIQAPAEAVSTIKRLVRQRMRWAEGASHNIKIMLPRLLFGRWEAAEKISNYSNYSNQAPSTNEQIRHFGIGNSLGQLDIRSIRNSDEEMPKGKIWVPSGLTRTEKLEFAYLAPYYLQAAFFVIGTFSWFISEAILGSRLPFWTAALGWSLVFTNILALPLMNIVGLFLEESDERDYIGILSFIALSYVMVPFQAYAAIKGFLEQKEGPWFRTPKTGLITDTFTKITFGKYFRNLLGKQPGVTIAPSTTSISLSTSSLRASNKQLTIDRLNLAFRPLIVNNFAIRPRQIKWAGNVSLIGLLILSVVLTSVASAIPYVKQKPAQKRILKSIGTSINTQAQQQLPPQAEIPSDEITDSKLVSYPGRDGKSLEYIFYKNPRFRTKFDGKELDITLEKLEGIGRVIPDRAEKNDDGYKYYGIAEGVDLVYQPRGGEVTEEVILNSYRDIKSVDYSVKTIELVPSIINEEIHFASKFEGGEPLLRFTKPYMYEQGNSDERNFDIEYAIEKDQFGWKVQKVLTEEGKKWLADPGRVFPVVIDPTQVVSTIQTAVSTTEAQWGSTQRKIAYMPNATGGAAWYTVYEDGTDVWYEKCAASSSCDANGDWTSRTDVDTADTGHTHPSVWKSGDNLWIAWADDALSAIYFRSLDSTSDTLGTRCQSPDTAESDPSYVSIAVAGDGDIFVAMSFTAGIGAAFVWKVATGTCTFTAITTSSGLTINDPMDLVTIGNNLFMVYNDGDLSASIYVDDASPGWDTSNQDINGGVASNADTDFSVATDGTDIWIVQATTTTGTESFRCGSCGTSSPTWTDIDEPFSSQSNGSYVSVGYISATNQIVAMYMTGTGASEVVNWKTSDADTISWGGNSTFPFTPQAGGMDSLSSTMSVTNDTEIAAVSDEVTGTDLEFSTLPENTIILALLAPFLSRLFKKRNKKERSQVSGIW